MLAQDRRPEGTESKRARGNKENTPVVQHKPDEGIQAVPAPVTQAGALGVIVDDTVNPRPGQMRRSAFMSLLRVQIEVACDEELAEIGRTSRDCPYIVAWLAHYEGQTPAHIERAVRAYTTSAATDAAGLIAAAAARAKAAVRQWKRGDAATATVAVPGEGPAPETAPPVQAKAEGSAAALPNPAAVRARLGPGEALDASVRARMERGFGQSFGDIRVHTDARASKLSTELSARAFTVGRDIGFAADRYRPGTFAGDLLLAHELAHSLQQNRATATARAVEYGESRALEAEADQAALGAVMAPEESARFAPIQAGGLRLQRCKDDSAKAPTTAQAPTKPTTAQAPTSPTTSSATAAATASRTAATTLIAAADQVKAERDKLRSAVREIRKGRALGFHKIKTPKIVDNLTGSILQLPAAEQKAAQSDFLWMLTSGPPGAKPRASDKTWKARVHTFFARLESPLEKKLTAAGITGSAAHTTVNRLHDTPESVLTLIHEVATPTIPPALVYAVAANEGLVDRYVRDQVPGAGNRLTDAQLKTVRTDSPVTGITHLGIDTYFNELEYKHLPLSGYLPAGFDAKKVQERRWTNEKKESVRSADASDLKMGLQIMVAMLSRRQALFLEDVRSLKYAAPSTLDKVYFTYVYYNPGPGTRLKPEAKGDGGYQTLYRHRPDHPTLSERRALADWFKKGDYPFAVNVRRSYDFVVAAGILKGY